ncbi:MAG: MMPL family transporter [Planctomycetota bacterium]|nr:MMPL family transporter [Planctomycetota bacterium]
MTQGLRHRLFGGWAGVITRFPVAILVIAGALAAASVIYAATHWKFQSDRNLLISPDLEWNRRFIVIEESLPGTFDIAVVVDAGPGAEKPGSAQHKAARETTADLAKRFAASKHVERVLWGFDPRTASPKALRVAPMEEFLKQIRKIGDSGPLLASPTPQAMLAHIQAELLRQAMGQFLPGAAAKSAAKTSTNSAAKPAATGPAQDEEANAVTDLQDLNRLLGAYEQVLAAPPEKSVKFADLAVAPDDRVSDWEYLASENGRLLFLRVSPKLDMELLDPMGPALDDIRRIVNEADKAHPQVGVGLTGVVVMDAEETQSTTWDSTWTSAVATVLITGLLIVAFHGWRGPVLAVVSLLFGIAWTWGFLFLAIGHLQVLSVVFNLMLLSLGVAYGIYIISAFELLRHDFPDTTEGFRQTLARTLEMVGPGVATGAGTTAAAFATTIFTDFTGVAEMGLIAGVGILFCFIAMFSVFPAMLRLFKKGHRDITPLEDRTVAFFKPAWAMPFVRHPIITLVVAALLTFASLLAILDMHFDSDLIKLQPRSAPSVQWMERIVRDGHEERVWKNISMVGSLEEGRRLAEAFRALPTVEDVGGVGLLFPKDEAEKIKVIERVRAGLGESLVQAEREQATASATQTATGPATATATEPTAAGQPDLQAQVRGLRGAFGAASLFNKSIPPAIDKALKDVAATLGRIDQALTGLDADERDWRTDRLTAGYREWRGESVRQIIVALDTTPLSFTDLPPDVMANYHASDGRYVLEIYPKVPRDKAGRQLVGPLDRTFLPTFVEQTLSVDPQISGVMAQIHWSGDLIKNAYVNAGYLALVLVVLLIALDYGGWLQAAICLPLAGAVVAAVFTRFPHHLEITLGLLIATTALFAITPRFRHGLHDSLLILLPVAMAFAVTFGIMWLIDMEVNAANIIVLPLMFGIGVDSGVHVLNRFRQDPDGQPVGLTQGTGKGITITCLTSVIGFGVMIPSSHRGISSLGTVLALGLALTMLACWTVMPAWLQLIRKRSAERPGSD